MVCIARSLCLKGAQDFLSIELYSLEISKIQNILSICIVFNVVF